MSFWDMLPADPFERAALRTLLSVRPEAGRQPGDITTFATNALPFAGYVGANAARGLWDTMSYPGRILSGETPYNAREAIGHALDVGLMGGGRLPFARPGELGAFGGRPTSLPMDEASRLARAKQLGYSDQPFYRGEASGNLPVEYPSGAHYARDPGTATGFAERGGQTAPREFRLNLTKALRDYEDISAADYARLVAAAEPQLARQLVDLVAEGKSVDWFNGYAKYQPDAKIMPGRMARAAIEQGSGDPIGLFRRAGFDAIDSGGDVRMLSGEGQRLKDAAFDPAKSGSPNIMASGAGILGGGVLSDFLSRLPPHGTLIDSEPLGADET